MATQTNTTTTTQDKSAKATQNFRNNGDVENFYRFVNDNDLRREAKMLLGMVHSRLTQSNKKSRKKKSKKKLQ